VPRWAILRCRSSGCQDHCDAIAAAWEAAATEVLQREPKPLSAIPEQFLILVTCRDEKQQVELLGRFGKEGLECRGMMG
jgi:hypothetical protein